MNSAARARVGGPGLNPPVDLRPRPDDGATSEARGAWEAPFRDDPFRGRLTRQWRAAREAVPARGSSSRRCLDFGRQRTKSEISESMVDRQSLRSAAQLILIRPVCLARTDRGFLRLAGWLGAPTSSTRSQSARNRHQTHPGVKQQTRKSVYANRLNCVFVECSASARTLDHWIDRWPLDRPGNTHECLLLCVRSSNTSCPFRVVNIGNLGRRDFSRWILGRRRVVSGSSGVANVSILQQRSVAWRKDARPADGL